MTELKSRVRTTLTVNHANRLLPAFNQKQKSLQQLQQNAPSLQKNSNIIIYQRSDIDCQHTQIYQFKSQNRLSLPNMLQDSSSAQVIFRKALLPTLSQANSKNACPPQTHQTEFQVSRNDKSSICVGNDAIQSREKYQNIHGTSSTSASQKIRIQNEIVSIRSAATEPNQHERRQVRAITTIDPPRKQIPTKFYTQAQYKGLVKMLVQEELKHNETKQRLINKERQAEQTLKRTICLQQQNILFQTQLQSKCVLIGQFNAKILELQDSLKSLEFQNASLKTWKQSYESLLQLKTDEIFKLNSKIKEVSEHLKQTTDLLNQKQMQIACLKHSQFDLKSKFTQLQSKISILSQECKPVPQCSFETQTDEYDLKSQIEAQLKKEHAIQLGSLAKKLVYFQKMIDQIEQSRKQEQEEIQNEKTQQNVEEKGEQDMYTQFEQVCHNPLQIYAKQLEEALEQTTAQILKLRMQKLNDRYSSSSLCTEKKIFDSVGDEIHSDSTDNNENEEESLISKIQTH